MFEFVCLYGCFERVSSLFHLALLLVVNVFLVLKRELLHDQCRAKNNLLFHENFLMCIKPCLRKINSEPIKPNRKFSSSKAQA